MYLPINHATLLRTFGQSQSTLRWAAWHCEAPIVMHMVRPQSNYINLTFCCQEQALYHKTTFHGIYVHSNLNDFLCTIAFRVVIKIFVTKRKLNHSVQMALDSEEKLETRLEPWVVAAHLYTVIHCLCIVACYIVRHMPTWIKQKRHMQSGHVRSGICSFLFTADDKINKPAFESHGHWPHCWHARICYTIDTISLCCCSWISMEELWKSVRLLWNSMR